MPGTYGSAVATPSPRKKQKLSEFFGMSRNEDGVFTKISPANHTNNPSNKKQPDIGAMMQHAAAKEMAGKVAQGLQNAVEKRVSTTDANLESVMVFVKDTVMQLCVSYETEISSLKQKLATEVRKYGNLKRKFDSLNSKLVTGEDGVMEAAEKHRAEVDAALGSKYNSGFVTQAGTAQSIPAPYNIAHIPPCFARPNFARPRFKNHRYDRPAVW